MYILAVIMLMVKITMTIMVMRMKTTLTYVDDNVYGDGDDHNPTAGTTRMLMIDTRAIYMRKISRSLYRKQTYRLNGTSYTVHISHKLQVT